MDFSKTERILIGQILTDLYAGAPVEAQRTLKLRMLINQLAPPLSADDRSRRRIVEIGCGYGFTSNYLSLLFPHTQIVGIDPDAARVAAARETVGRRGNIRFYTADECAELSCNELDCDTLILNHLLWRPEYGQSQKTLLETASGWLQKDGELLVRALDPETHWLRVMAANLRESILAGEALTRLSKDDLAEFCKGLGFAQNHFRLDGMYYRAGSVKAPVKAVAKRVKQTSYVSTPRKARVCEYDEALNFIFSKPWDELKV